MTSEQFHTDILPLRNKLYRYALSIVLDVSLAEDVLQEVYIKLWTKREQLATVQHREAWCIRMVRNQAIDRLRQRKKQPTALTLLHDQKADTTLPSHQIEQQDLLAKIRETLIYLPEQQREIFRLRELMGYSNAEIEEMLELNHSQVKVNLHRARKLVRERIKKIVNYGV